MPPHPSATHALATHALPAPASALVHARPHAPQWRLSLVTSAHTVPQATKPGRHPVAGECGLVSPRGTPPSEEPRSSPASIAISGPPEPAVVPHEASAKTAPAHEAQPRSTRRAARSRPPSPTSFRCMRGRLPEADRGRQRLQRIGVPRCNGLGGSPYETTGSSTSLAAKQHARLASHEERQYLCALHIQANSSVGARSAIATYQPKKGAGSRSRHSSRYPGAFACEAKRPSTTASHGGLTPKVNQRPQKSAPLR